MEMIKCFQILVATLIAVLTILGSPTSSQITTACTSSLISSFTPCLNFITGSINGGGGSPTAQCCGALGSLVSSSTECACLIVTGNVPLNLPINRTLAISFPRLCKSQSVPLRCQATATPLPSPGTVVSYGPSLPPLPPTTASNTGSDATVSSPPVAAEGPVNQGQKPLVLPSSTMKVSYAHSPAILLLVGLGGMLFI